MHYCLAQFGCTHLEDAKINGESHFIHKKCHNHFFSIFDSKNDIVQLCPVIWISMFMVYIKFFIAHRSSDNLNKK